MTKDTSAARDDVAWWVREMNACVKRNENAMRAYFRNVRWFQGDMSGLIDQDAAPTLEQKWQQNLDNMLPFVTEANLADLFFRNPQAIVRCPFGSERGVFTNALARVETMQLNDTIEQIGYFTRKRRQILDALLGPYGVLMFTYNVDPVVDVDALNEARLEAGVENQQFLAGNPRAMDVQDKHLHSIHIEQHRKLEAEIERGVVEVDAKGLKFLRKHIALHEALQGIERPADVIRNASVVCRRINPSKFFYDTSVDDYDQARWMSHERLVRKDDVLKTERYAKSGALEELKEAQDLWVRSDVLMPSGLESTGTLHGSDPMVRIHEVIDLVDGQVREFAEGGTKMLCVRPYDMRVIQPHGPFNLLMFSPDPQDAAGIPVPTRWEAEQAAATTLASVNVAVAQLSLPSTLANEACVTAEIGKKIVAAVTGEIVLIPNVPPDQKLEDQFFQTPTAELKETNLAVLADVRNKINQLSGRGGQRNLAGDRSGSATEAAIVSGAADSISDDRGAIVDRSMRDDCKMMARLTRMCVPKAQVVENCGEEALKFYPDLWASEDIRNDRGVDIVVGSTRRRNTDVESKLAVDGLAAAMALPVMQTPQGQLVGVEILERWFADQQMPGLPWDAVRGTLQQQIAIMEAQAAMGMAQPGGAPAEDGRDGGGEPGSGPLPSEMTEPSAAGQEQGMANVGGGRVATGASRGDVQRLMRGGRAGAA